MGQKTNAKILQLTTNKNAKRPSRYFEQNPLNESTLLFKDQEIRFFVERFLNRYGLWLHTISIQYSETTLDLYLSYYISSKAKFIIKKQTKVFSYIINKYKRKLKKPRKFSLNKRLRKIKQLKQNMQTSKKSITTKLLESLSIYTNNFNIIATFQILNRGLSARFTREQLPEFKSIIFKLRKYSKSNFFKEAVNILTVATFIPNSAKLVSDYIANQLQFLKKHTFFMKFLKTAFTLLANSKFSKIYGLKIEIHGRINGVRRSKKRIITINTLSRHSFNESINYHHSISYTQNGTMGIKVWIHENTDF